MALFDDTDLPPATSSLAGRLDQLAEVTTKIDLRSTRLAKSIIGMIFSAVVSLSACVSNEPFRTALEPTCEASTHPSPSCSNAIHEHAESFDLLFAEFDDQGLPFPSAAGQQKAVMDALDAIAKSNGNRVAIYVFVHGWKNNSSEDNDNVTGFKQELAVAARDEAARNPGGANQAPRRVVGIFVSWRGLATNLEPFDELSFWTRKAAADRVAHGSVRGFFSRLKLFQCKRNDNPTCSLNGTHANQKNVRLVLIGHSFGGLILYNAVEQALVESLVTDEKNPNPPPVPRFGDMVILLNPAFEASLYAPLKQIAESRGYPPNEPPVFVTVTSKSDWATGLAFPAGRYLNDLLELKTDDAEREAVTHTMGHIDNYITHDLTNDTKDGACAGWDDTIITPDQIDRNLALENLQRQQFVHDHPTLDAGWERQFCGGGRLTQRKNSEGPPNMVIWNVLADPSIMDGHSDLVKPPFVSFMRQLSSDPLYEDQ